jgi:hypothetical protein
MSTEYFASSLSLKNGFGKSLNEQSEKIPPWRNLLIRDDHQPAQDFLSLNFLAPIIPMKAISPSFHQ